MKREVMCHAANLFFESRGETPLGQRWVLDVVRNRVHSSRYPDDYCSVIKQYFQFSWYNELRYEIPEDSLYWEDYIVDTYKNDYKELIAWSNSFNLALQHYFYSGEDLTNGSIYYMTIDKYNERDRRGFNDTVVTNIIGNHIFFKPCKRKNKCYHF